MALLFTSLEITSPNVREFSIPWYKHLLVARQMIICRRIEDREKSISTLPGNDGSKDIEHFLLRWFARLDILGSFLNNQYNSPLLLSRYLNFEVPEDTNKRYKIDCILGFTWQLADLLVKFKILARRIRHHHIHPDDASSKYLMLQGKLPEDDLKSSRAHDALVCSDIIEGVDCKHKAAKMKVTNEAFHWAADIFLRVLLHGESMATDQDPLSHAAGEVVKLISRVQRGGTGEACMTPPMFFAGCVAWNMPKCQNIIRRRFEDMEDCGMMHVSFSAFPRRTNGCLLVALKQVH